MKPLIRITDKAFCYTPAVQTDLRKTFERVRQRQAKDAASALSSMELPMKQASKSQLKRMQVQKPEEPEQPTDFERQRERDALLEAGVERQYESDDREDGQ